MRFGVCWSVLSGQSGATLGLQRRQFCSPRPPLGTVGFQGMEKGPTKCLRCSFGLSSQPPLRVSQGKNRYGFNAQWPSDPTSSAPQRDGFEEAKLQNNLQPQKSLKDFPYRNLKKEPHKAKMRKKATENEHRNPMITRTPSPPPPFSARLAERPGRLH